MTVDASNSSIKAVVLDWGGVLTVPPAPVIEDLYDKAGVDKEQLRIRREAYKEEDPNSRFARLERGEITLESYLAWSREDLPGAEVIWDPQSPYFLFDLLAVIPKVVERVKELRDRGFLTGLLSNNIAEAWPTVAKGLDLDHLFDVVVNSAFIGMRKPEKNIFNYLLEQLGLEPHQVLFLDDNPVNVRAAKKVGLQIIKVVQPVAALDQIEQILELPSS